MAFDEKRGQVVLFGGLSGERVLGETWTWDGRTWTEQHPASVPPARYGAGFASDLAGHLVLFGGIAVGGGNEAQLTDTWTWDGHEWTEQHPATSTPKGQVNVMVSGGSGAVLLFGVSNLFAHTGDQATWRWDGHDWAALITTPNPQLPSLYASASIDQDGSVFSFGGRGPGNQRPVNDMWRLSGREWSQLHPSAAPPPRTSAALAFIGRGSALLFGGQGTAAPTLGDTWAWTVGQWTPLKPGVSPSARTGHAMIFDGARNQAVLFGGVAIAGDFTETPLCDTWVWRP